MHSPQPSHMITAMPDTAECIMLTTIGALQYDIMLIICTYTIETDILACEGRLMIACIRHLHDKIA